MNIIEYLNNKRTDIVYCIIDNIRHSHDAYSMELMKNLSDFTLTNIYSKYYDVYVCQNEDEILEYVSKKGYKHCVVLSTGNEFVNGISFFNKIEQLTNTDYYIYGHILDRMEAYYELHSQCYLINLSVHKELNYPIIGQQSLGDKHTKIKPNRSLENIHDDYTPLYIEPGSVETQYSHKMHGYNIIDVALLNGYKIYAFDDSIRNNKKYYYPENQNEFLKNLSYAYTKYSYCMTEFIHHDTTDSMSLDRKYDQIITPASGIWFLNYLNDNGNVILYDYNQHALDFYKQKLSEYNNIEFVHINLLCDYDITKLIKNKEKDTLINLTNIFNYEGTVMFNSLKYRLYKENMLLSDIPETWHVLIQHCFNGMGNTQKLNMLKKPTWHMNGDWD